MRVLQLTSSSTGGVARHARQVAGLLAGAGEQVLLAGPPAVVADSPVPTAVVDIADRPRAGDLSQLRRLRRLAQAADVVHAHGLRAGAAAVLAARTTRATRATRTTHTARGRRPAVVVTLHNLPVGGLRVRAVAAVLERVVARGADLVLGVSGDLVAQMARLGAPAERALVPAPQRAAAVTLDAAGARRLRTELGVGPEERLVLTVGRLAPQKGLDLLCDAAAEFARGTGPPVRWVVVGDGPLAVELRGRVLGEALPVVVAGRREDVPQLLAAADVVVSTSTWEGQPLAVQEALQAGCAVVATDVGGTREVTGDAAVLVPPAARPLAAAIARVLRDDDERYRLQERAQARARRLPTPQDVLAQLRDCYASLELTDEERA